MTDSSHLSDLKQQILNLSIADQQALQQWLMEHMSKPVAEEDWFPSTQNPVHRRQHRGKSCFQLEGVKCGKVGCKCASGELHGPYWYEYFRQGDKVRKRYHGKRIKPAKP